MRILTNTLWVAGLGCVPAGTAAAAVLTLAGSVTGTSGANNDQIDRWRTNTVAKTLDADGDNVYGTAGYVLYGTDAATNANGGSVPTTDPLAYANAGTGQATLKSVPAYLTLSNNGQTQVATSYGYRQIDDPRQPVGASVSDVESGAALKGSVALGTEVSLVNITIGSDFPGDGLRIGVLLGNTDAYEGTFRLTQTTGGSASASVTETVPVSGAELQMAFFDLTGAAAGDVFTLYGKKTSPQPTGGNTNTNVIYGGLTFDALPAATPEPTGAVALGVAGVWGLARRRARRGGERGERR